MDERSAEHRATAFAIIRLLPGHRRPAQFSKHLLETLASLAKIEPDHEDLARLLAAQIETRLDPASKINKTGETRGGARQPHLTRSDVLAVRLQIGESQQAKANTDGPSQPQPSTPRTRSQTNRAPTPAPPQSPRSFRTKRAGRRREDESEERHSSRAAPPLPSSHQHEQEPFDDRSRGTPDTDSLSQDSARTQAGQRSGGQQQQQQQPHDDAPFQNDELFSQDNDPFPQDNPYFPQDDDPLPHDNDPFPQDSSSHPTIPTTQDLGVGSSQPQVNETAATSMSAMPASSECHPSSKLRKRKSGDGESSSQRVRKRKSFGGNNLGSLHAITEISMEEEEDLLQAEIEHLDVDISHYTKQVLRAEDLVKRLTQDVASLSSDGATEEKQAIVEWTQEYPQKAATTLAGLPQGIGDEVRVALEAAGAAVAKAHADAQQELDEARAECERQSNELRKANMELVNRRQELEAGKQKRDRLVKRKDKRRRTIELRDELNTLESELDGEEDGGDDVA